MQNHLPIIDADAHVIETEHTWDYLEPSEKKFRPRLFYTPDDETRQYWVIDDKIRGFRFPTLSERQLRRSTSARVETSKRRRPRASWTTWRCGLSIWMSWASIFRCCTILFGSNRSRPGPRSRRPSAGAGTAGSPMSARKSQGRLRYSCVVPAMNIDEAPRAG